MQMIYSVDTTSSVLAEFKMLVDDFLLSAGQGSSTNSRLHHRTNLSVRYKKRHPAGR